MRKFKLHAKYDAFQFDATTVINVTGSSAAGNDLRPEGNKVYYDKNLIKIAGPLLIHDQFGQQEPLPQNHGKTKEFRGFKPLAKATTPLTEGVTPNGNKLDMFTVNATISQYGDYVTISDMLDLTSIDPMVLQAQETLGDQAGRTLDTITREVINAGTNVIYAGGRVSRTTLTSSDKLNVTTIKLAVRALKNQNTPLINGHYMAVIHPDVAFDLTEDSTYKELFKYTDNSSFKNGHLFNIENVEFYESTEAKKFVTVNTPASGDDPATYYQDAYSTLVIGKGAYGVTKLDGKGLETIIKQLGSGGTADPLNQRATIGWKGTKAVAILVQQYMVRIESASSFNDHEAN